MLLLLLQRWVGAFGAKVVQVHQATAVVILEQLYGPRPVAHTLERGEGL